MADCSGEKPSPVWRMAPPEDPVDPPAETFLAKIKVLLFGKDLDKGKNRCSVKTPAYHYGWCTTILSTVFVLSTIGCAVMWFTDIYLDSILKQMTLKEGTEIFKAWKNPPVKPLICVHVFNYTNMEDYIAKRSTKIHVNETGPYCYRETLEKIDIKFYDNGTVSYGDRRTHVFEPNNSTGSMNDTLVVPNLPLISAIAMGRDSATLIQLALGTVLRSFDMTTMIKVPAHEFLFGYNDNFVDLLKGISKFLQNEMPFEKFGMLAMRAAVTKDRLTITTGSTDLDEMGVVTAVNGAAMLTAWDDDQCNRLDGSDGAFFPRHHINSNSKLYLFHKDLCRKLPLVFEKEVDFQDGVMGMRFHTPPDVYNTTGSCYCKRGVCPPVGVFDISPCAAGAPIMMSYPHLMYAESSVTEHLEGLHPDPKRHDFFIDIQPILGFTLGTVSRIQINVQIRKSQQIAMLDEFEDKTILPVVWFEVTADRLPPDLFNMIFHASVTVQWIQWSLQWGLLAVSLLSLVCLLTCPCLRQPLPPPTEVIVVKLSSV